jgi:predicted methyltransferase
VALLAVAAGLTAVLLGTSYQTVGTLRRLEVVEAERDGWQRPAEVVDALELAPGQAVVDLGCGSGYFTLKLSDRVGDGGRVLAVDIRRLPLILLRLRALLGRRHNLSTLLGTADDPGLRPDTADAVLVANTLHEIARPAAVLPHLWRALRPGGRLVVVDPNPAPSRESEAHHFESSSAAEAALREAGFEVLRREEDFVLSPSHGSWWLIVARRPGDQRSTRLPSSTTCFVGNPK